jgi:hypothetical protein
MVSVAASCENDMKFDTIPIVVERRNPSETEATHRFGIVLLVFAFKGC